MDNDSADPSFLGSIPSQNIRIVDRDTLPSDAFLAPPPPTTEGPYTSDAVVANAVVATGLDAATVTEDDVRQFMTFCGSVEALYYFPHPPSASALVFFSDKHSAGFAVHLSGGLFRGKQIRIRPATAVEAENRSLTVNGEPTQGEEAEIPETRTGLWLRQHMRKVAEAVKAKTSDLVHHAEEGVAKARHGALSLELKAAHAVADMRNPRDRVPVYGNGLTTKQYDHTPTQPQWGEEPAWQRVYAAPAQEQQQAPEEAEHAEGGKTL